MFRGRDRGPRNTPTKNGNPPKLFSVIVASNGRLVLWGRFVSHESASVVADKLKARGMRSLVVTPGGRSVDDPPAID